MIWEVDEDCDRCVSWAEFQTMCATHLRRHTRGPSLLGRPCTAPLASRCSARAPTRMSPSCRLWIGAARFYRVRNDKTGWEPRTLFNVVEFMMHDKDCSGTIDMDECMEILFRRFGKDLLESKVNEFMSKDEDGDQDITFTEFTNMDLKSRRATRKD